MSFDKDYPNRKDWRKPYRGAPRFDRECRPGGDCPWCLGRRTYKSRLLDTVAQDELTDGLEQAAYWLETGYGLTDDVHLYP